MVTTEAGRKGLSLEWEYLPREQRFKVSLVTDRGHAVARVFGPTVPEVVRRCRQELTNHAQCTCRCGCRGMVNVDSGYSTCYACGFQGRHVGAGGGVRG